MISTVIYFLVFWPVFRCATAEMAVYVLTVRILILLYFLAASISYERVEISRIWQHFGRFKPYFHTLRACRNGYLWAFGQNLTPKFNHLFSSYDFQRSQLHHAKIWTRTSRIRCHNNWLTIQVNGITPTEAKRYASPVDVSVLSGD